MTSEGTAYIWIWIGGVVKHFNYLLKVFSEREIATTLQVSKTTVHKDLAFLSNQAKEGLRAHIEDKLPAEYQKCMVGINQVLSMA